MKKRKIFLGVLLASAVFGMASCGGSKTPADEPANNVTDEQNNNNVVNYVVTFNSNGGSSVEPQTIKENGKVLKPTDPTKADDADYYYSFDGWYKDAALTEAYNFNAEVKGTLTLYAKWTSHVKMIAPATFDVTFNVNGGTEVFSQEIEVGQKVERPTDPTKAEDDNYTYTFAGWYKDANLTEEYDFNTEVFDSFVLYAKWNQTAKATQVENKYIVSFNTNSETTIAPQQIVEGQKVERPTDPTKAANAQYTYTFAGWYKDTALTEAYDFNENVTGEFTLYAKWNSTVNQYVITFISNGGSVVNDQNIAYGEKATEPTSPSKAEDANYTYTFAGWYKDEGLSEAYDFNTEVTGALTLYAKWTAVAKQVTPASYEITFNANGGTAVSSQTIEEGQKVERPTDPTKTANAQYTYIFAGWYKDSALTEAYDFNENVTGEFTLYAKWNSTVNQYVITFISNGGSVVNDQNIAYGEKATEPTSPSKAEDANYTYTFAGWYKDEGLSQAYDFNSEITGALTLYAKWTAVAKQVTPASYEITFNTNGGTAISSLTIQEGQKVVKPTDPTKAEDANYTYTFVGWYKDAALTEEYDFNTEVTGAFTLYAKWDAVAKQVTPASYEITFNTNGGTAISSQTIEEGQKVVEPTAPTKTANAQYTYSFEGWYKDAALTEEYDFNSEVNESLTLYAKWTETVNQYLVSFVSNGGTTVSAQFVDYGSKVEKPSNPTKASTAQYSYEFVGWYTDSGLTNAYSFDTELSTTFTLYAKWTETVNEYAVTFNTNGGTTISSQNVEYGSKVTKPADPTKAATSTEKYTFAGWYANSGLTEEYDFNTEITGVLTLYAKWNATAIQNDDQISIGFGEGLTPWTQLILEDGQTIPSAGNNTTIGTVTYNGFTFSSSKHRVDIGTSGVVTYNSQSSTITFTVGSTCTLHLEGTWASDTAGKVYLKKNGTAVYTSSSSYSKNDDISFTQELTAGTYTLSSDKAIRLSKLYRVVYLVTVTYNTEHGSVAATQIEKGGKLESLPELYAEGYVFKGWYKDTAYAQEVTTSTVFDTNTTIYAKWEEYNPDNYVTVSFDTGLSTEVIESVVIEKGTKLTSVPELSLTGYRFDGWYTDSSFNIAFNANANITGNLTLYAKFVKQYTVTFIYEDNTTISSVTLDENEQLDINDIPTTKYVYSMTFDGWYNGSTKVDLDSFFVTANTTLTAKYVASAVTTNVEVITSGASLESLYAEFLQFDTATEYAAYVKLSTSSAYTKLDNQLIRKYRSDNNTYDYYRVDAVGLKAGTYTLKIVPIISGSEVTASQTEVSNLVVTAHDRSGFAFSSASPIGSANGAYNSDGTLKSGAQVIYVTNSNAKTVSATVGGTTVTGLQAILDAKQTATTSSEILDIRIIGTIYAASVDSFSSSGEGLQIKGAKSYQNMNLTVEGIGNDAGIHGFGILIRNCSNVELRNFAVMNCLDDSISVDTNNCNLWIHNLDLFYGQAGGDSDQAKGDGTIDIKKSQYITVSYNHYVDSGKASLLDAASASSGYVDNITMHHNWFDHSDSRHPRCRNGQSFHIYNNYYDGNAKYGAASACGASVFVENNYFRSTTNTIPFVTGGIGNEGGEILSGEKGGLIKEYGNYFDGSKFRYIKYSTNASSYDAYDASSRNEVISSSITTPNGGHYSNFDTASTMYSYTVQTPQDAKETVMQYAGRVQGGDFKWSFDNSIEDSNYAVISALKSAVVNYSSKLISVQSIGEQSSGSQGGNTDPVVSETTVEDVISMIAALPEASSVKISDKTAIQAARAAFNSLSSTDQNSVTNKQKLIDCETALNTLLSAGSHTMTFDNGTTDSNGFFTVSGNLKSGATAKTYNGVTYTTALKMESATTITFTSGTATLTIITDAASGKGIKLDGTTYKTDANGVVTITLSANSHTITKGDSMNVYALIVE